MILELSTESQDTSYSETLGISSAYGQITDGNGSSMLTQVTTERRKTEDETQNHTEQTITESSHQQINYEKTTASSQVLSERTQNTVENALDVQTSGLPTRVITDRSQKISLNDDGIYKGSTIKMISLSLNSQPNDTKTQEMVTTLHTEKMVPFTVTQDRTISSAKEISNKAIYQTTQINPSDEMITEISSEETSPDYSAHHTSTMNLKDSQGTESFVQSSTVILSGISNTAHIQQLSTVSPNVEASPQEHTSNSTPVSETLLTQSTPKIMTNVSTVSSIGNEPKSTIISKQLITTKVLQTELATSPKTPSKTFGQLSSTMNIDFTSKPDFSKEESTLHFITDVKTLKPSDDTLSIQTQQDNLHNISEYTSTISTKVGAAQFTEQSHSINAEMYTQNVTSELSATQTTNELTNQHNHSTMTTHISTVYSNENASGIIEGSPSTKHTQQMLNTEQSTLPFIVTSVKTKDEESISDATTQTTGYEDTYLPKRSTSIADESTFVHLSTEKTKNTSEASATGGMLSTQSYTFTPAERTSNQRSTGNSTTKIRTSGTFSPTTTNTDTSTGDTPNISTSTMGITNTSVLASSTPIHTNVLNNETSASLSTISPTEMETTSLLKETSTSEIMLPHKETTVFSKAKPNVTEIQTTDILDMTTNIVLTSGNSGKQFTASSLNTSVQEIVTTIPHETTAPNRMTESSITSTVLGVFILQHA